MSNHGVRRTPKDFRLHKRDYTLAMVATVFVFMVTAGYFLIRDKRYSHSVGQTIDTRIVAVGAQSTSSGSAVHYRAEALVSYEANSRAYRIWLPTTTINTNKDWLALKLWRRVDDQAEVRWDPAKPSDGLVVLHLR